MADISKLEQQADLLFNNVAGWENSTLQRIGKRIGKYGKMSLTDVKAINNIAVVKQDMDAITKELAKVTGYNISQIEQMYGELLEEQHLANQPLYDYRGKTFVPFAKNRELQAIARAYAKTTGETMINIAKTKALCIMGANGKPIGMQKYYTDVLDKAVMQVTTGATDFHTAMRDSIIELGGSGVRVDYGGGVTRRLDTVVRQNLLWGAKQASVEYNEMIYDELGCNGYEVDWHSNPRPSHAFMQGKQFVVGKARTINGIHYDSFDEANERLQDYGCLHYKTPIICGVSEPRYTRQELTRLNEQNAKKHQINGKEYTGYEVTQMQRRLETEIRNQKSIKNVAMASGDKKTVKDCNAKIKAYQSKYNEISEITGIQGDKKRMSIPRGTASVKGTTPTTKNTAVLTPKQELEQLKQKVQTLNANDDFVEWVQTKTRIRELEKEVAQQSSSSVEKELEILKNKLATLNPNDDFVEYIETSTKIRELEKGIKASVDDTKSSVYKKINKSSEASEQLSNIGFNGVSDKVLKLDDEMLVDSVNQLTELEEKFGALKKTQIYIDTSPTTRAIASVSHDSVDGSMQTLKLSSKHYGMPKETFIKKQKARIDDGWSMAASRDKYSVYSTTHEYGHIIENNVIGDAYKQLPLSRQAELDRDGLKATMWHNSEATKIQHEIIDIAKEMSGDTNLMSYEYMSDYGKTNSKEFFAECFANSQLGEPNLMGKAMSVWLERKGLIIK